MTWEAARRRCRSSSPGAGVEQEREEQVFRLGEIQGALEGAPGGTLLAERVTATASGKNA